MAQKSSEPLHQLTHETCFRILRKKRKKKNLEMHSIRKFYYKPTSFPSKVFFVVVFVLAELGKSLLNESKTTLA